MPWKPGSPGEVPTLGYDIIDWIADHLAAPGKPDYEPFVLYPEQEDFVLRWYELHPETGRRRFRRGVLCRPRGWGKSPLLACLAIVEALAPVVPDGWDADGQPVGRPWSDVRTPWVQLAAVSEEQTANTWGPLLEMLQGPVLDEYPGLEPLNTFVNLPRGKIEYITSSARSAKGNTPNFIVLDQTEEWVKSNGGLRMFETVKNNAAKSGGYFVESPNAFVPGEGSVAEQSAAFAAAIREGRARDDSLLYDHREAPADTNMADRESLTLGLRIAYGDSSGHPDGCLLHEPACPPGHTDLEPLISNIWDPTSDVQVSRADFLNQVTHASDSWLSMPEWASCANPATVVSSRDLITLGFDGSRHRGRGIADATALVACRVSDGHVWLIRAWEQPDGQAGDNWWVPTNEVEAVVRETFARYNVIGFFADPAADWRSYVAGWEAKYASRLKVRASRDHPIEWWMGGQVSAIRTVRALQQFHSAVIHGELHHDGGSVLTRHVLNARRRVSRSGVQIAKDHPDSPHKIDAAVAAVLAWQARVTALSMDITDEPPAMAGFTF